MNASMTSRLSLMCVGLGLWAGLRQAAEGEKAPMIVKPSAEQVTWQDMEIGMFFHFDIPIFTDQQEGDWRTCGRLDPKIFNPGSACSTPTMTDKQ